MNKVILLVIVFFSLTYFGYTAHDNTQSNSFKIEKLQKELYQLRVENKAITDHVYDLQKKFSFVVKASAYTPRKQECDDSPEHTALMIKPKPGWHVAVSHDLLWMLGKRIYIKGVGVRLVADLMHEKHTNKIDIMVPTVKGAKAFGMQEVEIVVLG